MNKKIVTIVGARPQFIKSAMLTHQFNKDPRINEIIIHTGQHYDYNMSGRFFEELGIPSPKYNLNISEKTHGSMTGKMLTLIEEILLKEKPNGVVVYGDTNSTLAGALAASKLHIPLFHVEAGLRSFNKKMPEEVNRVLTDHVSTLLFCPTYNSVKNLKNENITNGVFMVGDIMYDAALFAIKKSSNYSESINNLGLKEKKYFVATVHRAENTEDLNQLKKIFLFLEYEGERYPIIMPIHPRTKKYISQHRIEPRNIKFIDPVSYFDMAFLIQNSACIYTDSGGLQKEAYFHKTPCVTLRSETEWVETIDSGWNRLWIEGEKIEKKEILDYGKGESAKDIYKIINESGLVK